MITTACGACGKVHQVPDQAAGRKAKCGCGSLMSIPAVDGTVRSKSTAPVPRPSESPAVVATKTPVQKGLLSFEKIAIGVGSIVVIVLITAGAYFLHFRDRWENQHREQLVSLTDRVRSYKPGSDPQDAFVAGTELSSVMAGHTVNSTVLADDVQEALAKRPQIAAAIAEIERLSKAREAEKERLAEVEASQLAAQEKAKADAADKERLAAAAAQDEANLFRTDPATHFKRFAEKFMEAAAAEAKNNKYFSAVGAQYSVNVVATNSLMTPYTGEITGTLTSRDDGKLDDFRLTFGAAEGRWELRAAEGKDFLEATLHGRDVWESKNLQRFGDGLWVKVSTAIGSR